MDPLHPKVGDVNLGVHPCLWKISSATSMVDSPSISVVWLFTHVQQRENSHLSKTSAHFLSSCLCHVPVCLLHSGTENYMLTGFCHLGTCDLHQILRPSCCLHFCLSPLPENNFMNITIILFRDNVTKSNSEWWVLNLTGSRIFNQGSQALELVVFNDKVSPPSLGFLAGYG